ncbi:OmpA family protein [Micropruina sp.]|uniref:OmpA family protein n=1 Tax=Micropruina sp. TaxID=2737536 RepID=UPI0039E488CA
MDIRGRHLLSSVLLCLGLLAGCAPASGPSATPSANASAPPVGGTVISTGDSPNQMVTTLPQAVADQWNALASQDAGVEWVSTPNTTTIDTTARAVGGAGSQQLVDAINGTAGTGTDRSVLAALNDLKSPAGSPVWVFSPLLDTRDPLNFNELAFDEPPADVVKAIKKAKQLPDLEGRLVSFVINPVAGDQAALSDLQNGYLHTVWEGLAKAAGAKRVEFFDGTGTAPGQGVGPVVAVPQPDDVDTATQGTEVVCTLPTPALFVINTPTLIDRAKTLQGLKKCLAKAPQNYRVVVEGRTSGDPSDNGRATVELSKQRATVVAVLLKDLGVPAKAIYKVVGYGRSKPLVQPPSDARNRAVVVRFEVTR